MKNVIYDFIKSEENGTGLFLADLPTGYGKTYMSARSIHDYVTKNDNPKKVFYITTLIKNLPIKELEKAYVDAHDESGFERDVLVIKSNFDFVYDNLFQVDIPDRYKTTAYCKLSDNIKQLIQLEKRSDSTLKQFKVNLQDDIREKYEPGYRNDIQNIIKREMPKGVAARRNMIRNNIDFQWIGRLYPTVFMSDYKIYLLTVNKFLVRNTTLIEPSYDFIQNKITENAIIFIDEFDATKDTMQNVIIDRALDSQDDYIKLFEQIYKSMQLHEFPTSIISPCKEYENENNSVYTFESLSNDASELYTSFQMKYNYKTTSGSMDRKQSFLFNDNSYHTMLRNNCSYIRVSANEDEKQVQIYFENKEDYYANKSANDIVMYSFIRSINSFLNKFKILIYNWAARYSEAINKGRRNVEDEFTIENAMKSIYCEFSLSQSQIYLLMGDLCGSKIVKGNDETLLPDMSFYNNGFKYFEFVDGDEHLSQTIFNYIQIIDTPEKILLYLCNKSKVLGLSATATLPSVIGNYDISYLKKELGANYVQADSHVYERIGEELKNCWMAYETGKVKVNVEVLDYNKGYLSLNKRLKEITNDRDFIIKYSNFISTKSCNNDYIWKRYCNIISALKEFIIHDDIKSFLCLNMVLPQSGKASFDIDLFREVLKDLLNIYGDLTDDVKKSIVVLKSDNFDVEKDLVLQKLSDGEKIFILSSYKTIGAGQNLQYEIKDMNQFLTIYKPEDINDARIKYKDMDALYLGDITNLVANTYDAEHFDKKDMIKFFFQTEYLYQNDEINFNVLNRLIKLGFKTYSGGAEKDVPVSNKLREAKSVSQQVTRDVMQAVGRICRTYIKNPNVYIYTVEGLMGKLDIRCIEGRVLSPEMKALVKAKENMGYKYSEDEEEILNRAERISSIGKNYIMKMLSRNWNAASTQLWKELRECTLTYPTASNVEAANNQNISKLYIENIGNKKKYLFAQKGDFSDVIIDFINDKIVFSESRRCEGRRISVVSEDEARLQKLFMYHGLKEHFECNGWATTFRKNELIMSPVLFQNIYKGALGEVVGRFILYQELGIELTEIEEYDKFEFFDYEISPGVYIDFKHWKQNYPGDREIIKSEIAKKLEMINGKKVYIINILSDGDFAIHYQNDGKIIEIPGLLNNNGTVNEEVLNILKGEIANDN